MSRRNLVLFPALAIALHGLLGQTLWLVGIAVPAWVLLLSVVLAASWIALLPRRQELADASPVSRPLVIACAFVIAGILAWCAWTSWVTPDRSWDGLVSWSLRAQALGSPADLSRAFFSQPEIFAHSRSYPLLQPLLLASLGDLVGQQLARLFFPVLFLSIFCLILDTARRMGATSNWSLLMPTAFAVTPGYLDVGAGAIDSGYADLLLAYAVALGAAGLLRRDSLPLFLSCLLLPWIKPEGLVYALLFPGILAFGIHRRSLYAAAGGLGLSLLLWLPLRARLSFSSETLLYFVAPCLALLLLLAHEILIRFRSKRTRGIAVGILGVSLFVAGILGRSWLLHSDDPLLREFSVHLDELAERLSSLPALLLGFGRALLEVKSMGLVFLLLLPAFFILRGRVDRGGEQLAWFLGISLVLLLLAVLLSPERDLSHELKSRLSRLLLQIVPSAWILLTQIPPLIRRDAPGEEPLRS